MNARPPSGGDEQLARLIDRVLRGQPPRSAPLSLESRVMAEIRRRARLPWWQRSFQHWPRLVQLLFLPACAVCALAVLELIAHVMAAPTPLAPARTLVSTLDHALSVSGPPLPSAGILSRLAHAVPAPWLQATLALGALLYLLLFALCAVAYRYLFLDRQINHEPS